MTSKDYVPNLRGALTEKCDVEKDFAAKVREISNDSMAGLLALKDDADLDIAVFGGHGIVEVTTDPDISGLIHDISNVTLKPEDDIDQIEDDADITFTNNEEWQEGNSSQTCNVERVKSSGVNYYDQGCDKVNGSLHNNFPGEISTSMLLEENVNLIMSEMQTNKLSGSTVGSDLFIENETISLVSMDYASDSNSELSASMSNASERFSDFSSATLTEGQSQTLELSRGCPKILKPGEESSRTVIAVNEKAIRGHRKPLYPGKKLNTPANPAVNCASPVSCSSRGRGAARGRGGQQRGGANFGLGQKKNVNQMSQVSARGRKEAITGKQSPREGATATKGKSASGSGINKTTSPGNGSNNNKQTSRGRGVASPSANVPGSRNNSTPGKQSQIRTSSLTARISPSQNNTNRVASASPARSSVKSISQSKKIESSATKRSASSGPHHLGRQPSSDNKENKDQEVSLREKRRSSSANQNRLSGSGGSVSSGDAGSRSSSGSMHESWGKALDSYNFLVDTAQDGMAYKQIQMQRNAKDAPPAIRRALKTPNTVPSNPATPLARPNNKKYNCSSKTCCSPNRSGIGTDKRKAGCSTTAVTKPSQAPSSRPLHPEVQRNSSSSSSSGIPTPRRSDGSSPSTSSTDSNRRISPAMQGKKQVNSKISSLWKGDSSQERSNSRDGSPSSSRLPVFTKCPPSQIPCRGKPSSLPPSGIRAKSSTLPTNANLGSSGKSFSAADGISKSSTYEKISDSPRLTSDIHHLSKEPREGMYESPETGVKRGQVFELCDDYTEDFDANSSLDNVFDSSSVTSREEEVRDNHLDSTSDSVECLDSGSEPIHSIDSSTFKKKKKGSNIVELALPNADETIKSMCSFNEFSGSPTKADISVNSFTTVGVHDETVKSVSSVNSQESIETEKGKRSKKSKSTEEKVKTKSKVAQGLKKLFGSGRNNKDKKPIKEKDGRAQMRISRELSEEDKKVLNSQTVNTNPMKPKGPFRPEHKASPSAIVAPFNYSPPASCLNNSGGAVQNSNVVVLDLGTNTSNDVLNNAVNTNGHLCATVDSIDNENDEDNEVILDRPMTKTEMLLARRRKSYLTSTKSEEGDGGPGCMVTTV